MTQCIIEGAPMGRLPIAIIALLLAPLSSRALVGLDRVRRAAASLAQADGFPPDLVVDDVQRSGPRTLVRVTGDFSRTDEVTEELRLETWLGALSAAGVEDGATLLVRSPGATWRPIGAHTPDVPFDGPPRVPAVAPWWTGQVGLGRALLGRRIAISAGHGWLTNDAGGWKTQRSRWEFTGCGACRGITEDFFTAEFVTNQLLPLLHGLGADVVLVRDPDHSIHPATIVDDGGPGYVDGGGFEDFNGSGYGTGFRTSAAKGAKATFSPTLDGGPRRLSVRFPAATTRTKAALLEVIDAGGSTFFDLDQSRMGSFWRDLGPFWFTPATAQVHVTNGADTGELVVDAMRFGGGVFEPSGKPMWQMGAASYVPWAGAPPSVTQYGDVSIRPAYAEFTNPDAYISIHANASGQTGGASANGTSTYRFSCLDYDDHSPSTSATNCDDPPGSTRLIDLVHASMMRRVRADWDPAWGDRGRRVANFGELRTLEGTPGVLVETGFFDNLEAPSGNPPPRFPDNRSLHDPAFREAVAIGVMEGLGEFFTGSPITIPSRPAGLVARNSKDGTLRLSWRPVAGALAYRVQRIDGLAPGRERAWNAGQIVTATELVFSDLVPRGTYAFRVTASGAAGEGYASQAVVARFRGAKTTLPPAPVLHVNAYDRRDAWVQDVDNDLSTAIEHAIAIGGITAQDVFFDGAQDEAVEDGTVALAGYRVVDFQAGKDSTADLAISPAMQGILRTYADAGGSVIVSGEEIGYQLVEKSTRPEDRAFVETFLGTTYVEDDAATPDVAGAVGTAFAGFAGKLDDGTGGVYEVRYPDVLSPFQGASVALTYPDGRAAAIRRGPVLFFGFPLESIVPAASRIDLFSRAFKQLELDFGTGDLDLDGASDACETAHTFDPRDAADGVLDADKDGVTNAAECRAGTNPRDPPKLIDPPGSGGDAPGGCGCGCGGTPTWFALPVLVASLRRRRSRGG